MAVDQWDYGHGVRDWHVRLRRVLVAIMTSMAMLVGMMPAASANQPSFRDVNPGTPHYKEILWLASTGITKGYPDGTFGGMRTVVRQDMAAFLYRMAGSPKFDEAAAARMNRFRDVNARTSHYKEILWLATTGITSGYVANDGTVTFGGMRTVVRQDMAAFLHRYARNVVKAAEPKGSGRSFKDVDTRTPHRDDIIWLAKAGVTQGYGDGTFGGMRSVVRQDMAAFLQRMDTKVKPAKGNEQNGQGTPSGSNGGNTGGNGNNDGGNGGNLPSPSNPDDFPWDMPWNGGYITVKVGGTHQLDSTGLKGAQWSSSDPSSISVDANGLVFAKKGGRATITAVIGRNSLQCMVFAAYDYQFYWLRDYYKDGLYEGYRAFVYVKTNDPNPDSLRPEINGGGYANLSWGGDPCDYLDLKKSGVDCTNQDGYVHGFRKASGGFVGIIDAPDKTNHYKFNWWSSDKDVIVPSVAEFTLETQDPDEEADAWINQVIAQHTTASMNPVEKMNAIESYLAHNAGFTYLLNTYTDGEYHVAGIALGDKATNQPYWIRKTWDSYISPAVLADIANRIGGWDEPARSMYGDYPYGSAEWQNNHYKMVAVYKGEKHYYNVTPYIETGTIDPDTIHGVNFADTSWMYPVRGAK